MKTAGTLTSTEKKNLDKAERTTQAATEIIQGEAKAAAAKTERLKAARLARDTDAPPPAAVKRTRARKT